MVGAFNLSEKYEFVSWDDDIPNWMESHKLKVMFQTTNQIYRSIKSISRYIKYH